MGFWADNAAKACKGDYLATVLGGDPMREITSTGDLVSRLKFPMERSPNGHGINQLDSYRAVIAGGETDDVLGVSSLSPLFLRGQPHIPCSRRNSARVQFRYERASRGSSAM